MEHLLFTAIIFLISPISQDWQLKKNSSGIEVYIRQIEGSSFCEFKAVTVIADVTLTEVLDVILDVENYPSLFPDCINPRILMKDGKWHDIHYIQTKGPFPVKDRDSVFEQTAEVDKDGKHARITLKPLPDYIAENKNMIRIREGSGFWDLEQLNNSIVRVTYQFHSEPGGEIPSWLANSFMVTHPFKTLNNLRSRVKK